MKSASTVRRGDVGKGLKRHLAGILPYKTLVSIRQEDFARWVMPFVGGQEVRFVKPLKTEFNRHIIADAISQVLVDGDDLIFHYEFQVKNEKDVPVRGLEYNLETLLEHDMPVWTFVIYLKKRGKLPSPPWQSKPWQGRIPITFDYTVIDLSTMTAEELRETGLPGILPLMILTKDGATREVAEEIMTDLEPVGEDEITMMAYTLIALTFNKRKDDREWLRRRWKNMSNRLKDNWFIQEITEDARKETEKRVREEERRKLEEEQRKREEEQRKREEEQRKREEEQRKREEERRQEIERWRQTVVGLVEARFKNQKVNRIAKGQAALINDPQQLQGLILKVGLAQTAEEAEDYLLSWPESA